MTLRDTAGVTAQLRCKRPQQKASTGLAFMLR
jgi:hypothetical protein